MAISSECAGGCMQILKAVNQQNYGAHFAWVASDNWGNKRSAVQDNPDVAVGAITIQPKVKSSQGTHNNRQIRQTRNILKHIYFQPLMNILQI